MHLTQKSLSLRIAALVACASLLAAVPAAYAKETRPAVLTAGAVVVADEFSAQAAKEIMQAGGNAVDAAVAVAFTLAVTYPDAGNLGGGGFMTLYVDGKPYFLDYRERAPATATRNMYLDDKGQIVPGLSLVGPKAAGVPGTVMGLWEAHKRFGKLSWKQDMAPALHYATQGFEVSRLLAERRDAALKDFDGKTNFSQYFGDMKAGENFRQPELAATLQRIAEHGPKDFYGSKTADMLAAKMIKDNGLITRDDLKDYRAVWREPIQANWNGYRVITAPPPSSGGVGLVQLLKMKEDLKSDFKGVPLNSAQYIHLVSEIEKRVFADRAEYLGDPDFYKIPVTQLIDDAYLQKRAHEVNPNEPSPTESVKPGLPESYETTHFSIIDKWGNAVSNTYTLNGAFGSGVVVDGAGFLLNNEMDDFSSKPGVANLYGVVGKDVNAIAPGKRMLSSMTPTILTRGGKVALVIGAWGGSRIFTSIFQVMTDIYDYHLPLPQAIAQMRFHHQLLPPNTIYWESYQPIKRQLADELRARGYTLREQPFSGDVQTIQVLGRQPEAVADPRNGGVALLIK